MAFILTENRTNWLDKYRYFVYAFVAIFYLVGVLGLINSTTHSLFISLIPFSLLLSFVLILLFHYQSFKAKDTVLLLSIFVISFAVEAVGVATGVLFGDYSYGDGLGFKLWDTPIIIGINWIFVTYITASVVSYVIKNRILLVLISALSMVIYDVVLEQVAPKIDMWSWRNGVVPLQNYLVWFVMALLFQSFMVLSKIELKNRLALTLLVCQMLFFILLIIKL